MLAGGRWAPAGADLPTGEAAGHPPVETAAPFLALPPLLTCPVRGESWGEERSRERRSGSGVGREMEVAGAGGSRRRRGPGGAALGLG
jgi:hypothetical protein